MTTIPGTGTNDTLTGGDEADAIAGGDGGDIISGFGGPDQIQAGSGRDTIDGGCGDNALFAVLDDDIASTGDNIITPEGGDDLVALGAGSDTMRYLSGIAQGYRLCAGARRRGTGYGPRPRDGAMARAMVAQLGADAVTPARRHNEIFGIIAGEVNRGNQTRRVLLRRQLSEVFSDQP